MPSGRIYQIDGIESSECPVSIITAESREILDLEARGRRYRSSLGASLFGSDSAKWPAWWADAVNLIEINRILQHNAQIEAEREEMNHR